MRTTCPCIRDRCHDHTLEDDCPGIRERCHDHALEAPHEIQSRANFSKVTLCIAATTALLAPQVLHHDFDRFSQGWLGPTRSSMETSKRSSTCVKWTPPLALATPAVPLPRTMRKAFPLPRRIANHVVGVAAASPSDSHVDFTRLRSPRPCNRISPRHCMRCAGHAGSCDLPGEVTPYSTQIHAKTQDANQARGREQAHLPQAQHATTEVSEGLPAYRGVSMHIDTAEAAVRINLGKALKPTDYLSALPRSTTRSCGVRSVQPLSVGERRHSYSSEGGPRQEMPAHQP